MNDTCTGCHGNRVDDEYKDPNERADGTPYPADVHYNPGGMSCFKCHTEEEMHGTEGDYNHRYDGPPNPSCSDEGCHDDVSPEDDIEQHDETHLTRLNCATCPSVAYKNCYSCHVQQTDDGRPYYRVEPSQMAFRIGRNPRRSAERPWRAGAPRGQAERIVV